MVLSRSTDPTFIPSLESGDRLARTEFERRYTAAPSNVKAELVEGIVYVASLVRAFHGRLHAALMAWLGVYWAATPGVSVADNTTTRLDLDNEPQPDALLRIEKGGSSVIGDNGYIEGAPELIAEIATSSAAIDLGAKKNAYRRNRVQEYLVWQTFENQLSWFQWETEDFIRIEPDSEGIICSCRFPGLWLAVSDLLDGNLIEVLRVLQMGIEDPTHPVFVDELARRS